MQRKKESAKEKKNIGKRITTVPIFDSTKKLMEQNKKILNLVSNK